MTIRERFAMAAMQGLLSDSDSLSSIRSTADENIVSPEKLLADAAIQVTDALLAELEKSHD